MPGHREGEANSAALGGMNLKFGKNLMLAATMALGIFASLPAVAAQLDGDARAVIPKDVQQLIVVDYRAMQNSEAAMSLKARVLPPELKQLETALKSSGLNDNHDVDELAFAAFRTPNGGESTKIVGIAQGQFSLPDILANFKKQKVKATKLRNNFIYPMGASGMLVSFRPRSTPASSPSPTTPPSILYTSGTTGLPKGVELTGRNLGCALRELHAGIGLDAGSVCAAPIPFFHISGLGLLLAANLNGGQILLDLVTDTADLLRFLVGRGVTHAAVVPTVLQRLLALPEAKACRLELA